MLVIDSRSKIRQELVRGLHDAGFATEEVDTGSAGLHAIRRMLPDVIVLHSTLTDMHAFEICRRLKDSERYGDIHIIVTSEYEHDWRVASDAKHSLGIDLFVEKPDGIHTVVEAVALSIGKNDVVDQDQKSVLTQNAAQELKKTTVAYKAGDRAQAIACLRAGLQIDPLSFRLHYHLGLVLAGQNDDATNDVFGAIDALEASVAIRPKDFSALKNLATLYQRVGFVNKSIELWQRALQGAPDAQKRAEIRDHLISLL